MGCVGSDHLHPLLSKKQGVWMDTYEELLDHYHLGVQDIVDRAQKLL